MPLRRAIVTGTRDTIFCVDNFLKCPADEFGKVSSE